MVGEGKRAPRLLLGATWSAIENLGIMHIGGLARSLGWEVFYSQPKNHNFDEFKERVEEVRPNIVGYNCYSGAQTQLKRDLLRWLKEAHPEVRTVVGGPHPTYFPEDFVGFVHNIVMSEGFNAMRRILRGEVGPGIIEFQDANMERMALPDREGYYRDSPFHRASTIKSVFGESGCPYNCEYCNNSTAGAIVRVSDKNRPLEDRISLNVLKESGSCASTGSKKGSRAFPRNVRLPEDLIAEGQEILRLAPGTKMIYDQSDVWLQQSEEGQLHYVLAHRWKDEVGLPLHGQMRWEMTRGDAGDRRLDLAVKMGAKGLTFAIESADPTIREFVLDRHHQTELIYEGVRKIRDRGLTLRTEQITGLISGTTPKPSKMNLDLDLHTLALNVDLIREFGIPNTVWGSTLVAYAGTGIGVRSFEEGFATEDCRDPKDEFFDRSQLRFLKGWQGPEMGTLRVEKMKLRAEISALERKGKAVPENLTSRYNLVNTEYGRLCENLRSNPDAWLSGSELERYRNQNTELRSHFNALALTPEGHVLARSYLESSEPFGYERLGRETEAHLRSLGERGDKRALQMLATIAGIRDATFLDLNGHEGDAQIKSDIQRLAPYLAVLPKPDLAVHYVVTYAKDPEFRQRAKSKGGTGMGVDPYTLSTAVRRHLYENVLYRVNNTPSRVILPPERYPVKV